MELPRLTALLLALLLVGPSLFANAQAEKDDADKPSTGKKKTTATDDDAKAGDKDEEKDDTKKDGDKSDDDGKDGDDDNGFGAARKPTRRPSSREDKPEPKTPEEKEKAKLAKILEKRLGRKEEGYFVFQVMERKLVERTEEDWSEEEPPVASNQRGRRPSPFELVETAEFHVIEGRDETVNFLVDYLSEYPPPDKKSRSKRPKDAPPELPPPERDFRFFRSFPEGAEGNQAAQYLRDQAKAQYDELQAKKNYRK